MATDQTKPFHSARLVYRALEPEDEDFGHELESDPVSYIASQLGLERPQAKEDSKKHFDWLTQECLLSVAVCLPDPNDNSKAGKATGVVNLTGQPLPLIHHRNTEIGLGLLPAYQGKGYGTEAIEWSLQWAFESAGMHKVVVKAFEYNTGARRLYERMGFKHEGTAREMFWHNGRFWDDYEYGMLEGEWRARQDTLTEQ